MLSNHIKYTLFKTNMHHNIKSLNFKRRFLGSEGLFKLLVREKFLHDLANLLPMSLDSLR